MPDLQIEKHALQDALKVLEPALQKKGGFITSCVLFDFNDAGLVLRASDKVAYTSVKVGRDHVIRGYQGSETSPMSFAVEGQRLITWLSKASGEGVMITLGSSQEALFECGGLSATLPNQDPSLFSAKATFSAAKRSATEKLQVPAVSLLNALVFSLPLASTRDDYNDPQGEFRTLAIQSGVAYATNSRVVGMYQDPTFDCDLLSLGRDQVPALVTFLKRIPKDSTLTIYTTDTVCIFEADPDLWFGTLLPTVSLPMDKVSSLPKDLIEQDVWVAGVADIKSSLDALAVMADPQDTTVGIQVTGDGDNAFMTLSRSPLCGTDKATAKISVDRMSLTQDRCEMWCSTAILKQALGVFSGEVSFGFTLGAGYVKLHQEVASSDDTDAGTGVTKVCIFTLHN